MAKAKERVNKRNIFQLQERFQKFRTRCDFSVTMRSVDAAAIVSRRRAKIAINAQACLCVRSARSKGLRRHGAPVKNR
jgi:hypothetical protein